MKSSLFRFDELLLALQLQQQLQVKVGGGTEIKAKEMNKQEIISRNDNIEEKESPKLEPLIESNYPPNGALNLHPKRNFSFSKREEKEVREIWPQIVLPREAKDYGEAADKNKVALPSHLRLVRAERKVFKKLSDIQDLLRIALVPYRLWPRSLASELSGDFQQVSIWANRWQVSWVELVRAIINVLRNHGCLFDSVTSFTMLLPHRDEAYINFAWQMQGIWHVLVGKLQEYLPSTWLSICDLVQPGMHASELIELVVQRAQLVTRVAVESRICSTPEVIVNFEGHSAPHHELKVSESTPSKPGVAPIVQPNVASTRTQILDLRNDNRMVFPTNEPRITQENYAAQEKDNTCFNCGKTGHWAMNCRSKSKQINTNKTAEGEEVTIKGELFKSPRLAQKARKTFEKYKNKRDRAHLVEHELADDSSQDSISPVNRIEG
ncbi:hypothetical protein GcM3_218021 [Golovinomyces cichoracearum]|uniref:CCHC-type domain-containing protein n=1 Tax=Golovinomyces cichoracearum TaxID=62708 RepID=A0A420H7N3_9PEZI|nr:hypothetical protein GcM3_218021 [Golovinomyces cichoracearum]